MAARYQASSGPATKGANESRNGTMATHLTLICHAATPSLRQAAFAGPDEPIEAAGRAKAESAPRLRADQVWIAPSRAARDTAASLGLDGVVAADLRGCDHGSWTGRTLESLLQERPDQVAAWTGDPDAAPHGGESVAALVTRAGAWLDGQSNRNARLVAIADATFIRAAIVHAIAAPPPSYFRIDLAPLSRTVLSCNRRWRLQTLSDSL